MYWFGCSRCQKEGTYATVIINLLVKKKECKKKYLLASARPRPPLSSGTSAEVILSLSLREYSTKVRCRARLDTYFATLQTCDWSGVYHADTSVLNSEIVT